MSDQPIMLKLAARPCVVIGGGKVASRRTASLLEAGANVVVISPHMDEALLKLHDEFKVKAPARLLLIPRPWHAGDLLNAFLTVIATSDPSVNQAAADEARKNRCLVNRADAPELSDMTFPAHAHHGPITLAVHTSGISAAASAAIRRELSEALSPHWQLLLQEASDWRSKIQEAIGDPQSRRARLMAMTDSHAVTLLIEQGTSALQQYYATLADPAAADPEPETGSTDSNESPQPPSTRPPSKESS